MGRRRVIDTSADSQWRMLMMMTMMAPPSSPECHRAQYPLDLGKKKMVGLPPCPDSLTPYFVPWAGC